MSVRRFFVESIDGPVVEIEDDQASHAVRVLRLAVGDVVQLLDGQGHVATGTVARVGNTVVVADVQCHTVEPQSPKLDIAASLPKGNRADTLVEKLSELGTDRLIPIITQRTVVKPRTNKLDRFSRIAIESAKQCGRAWLMQVDPPTPVKLVASDESHDIKLFADAPKVAGDPEASDHQDDDATMVRGLPQGLDQAKSILVLIGPEGGWSSREREALIEAGYQPWRFGPHVMRVETAAMAAAAILRNHA